MDNKVYEKNNINTITLNLALPAIAEMLLQTFMGVADTAMVGSLGGYAIAAVSITDNPSMLVQAFFASIGVGTTALVARFVGSKDLEKSKETMAQSIAISIIFSLLFTLFALLLSSNIVKWMGAEKDTFEYALTYMRIVFLGLPAMIITMVMSGTIRGTGDTKTPMIVNGISNLINVLGNFLLIFESRNISVTVPITNNLINIFIPGAGIGVTGAAIATTFGRYVALILILRVLFNKDKEYHIELSKKFKLNTQIIRRIMNVGMPAAVEQLLLRFAQLLFFRIIASLGTVMIAAHKIALTAESLSFMPGWGFALSATTLVGQFLGAENPKYAKKSGYTAAYMATIVMTIFGILFFIFPRFFIMIFTKDDEIIENAIICLQIVAISQPFLAGTMVFAGGLRGAGDTRTVLWVTAFGSWVIRIGLGYLLTFHFGYGLTGAWAAMAIDLSIRGIIFFVIFKKGKWQGTKI